MFLFLLLPALLPARSAGTDATKPGAPVGLQQHQPAPAAGASITLAQHSISRRWRLEREAGEALPFTIGLNHAGLLWSPCPSYDVQCRQADLLNRVYSGNATLAALDAVRQLRGWGYSGSSYDLPLGTAAGDAMAARMPFLALTMPLNLEDGSGPSSWQPPSKLHFPDPWAADTQKRMHARITAKCEAVQPHRHNLIGYIWTDLPSYDIRAVKARGAKDWVSTLRCLPSPSDAGRRFYSRWLRDTVCPAGSPPSCICERYGLDPSLCLSWDSLKLCSVNNSATPAAMSDDYQFLPRIAEQIYAVANASVTACDPEALVLTDTFHGWGDALEPDSVLAVAAKFAGALSLQPGGGAYNKSMYERVHSQFGRPIFMADAGMAFPIQNYSRYVWNEFSSQRDAAAVYAADVVSAAQSGYMIGFNKCQLIDRVVDQAHGVGPLKVGLLSFNGTPHQPLTSLVAAANQEAIAAAELLWDGPLKTDDPFAFPVPNCTAFCKYYLICTCGEAETGALPPTDKCVACVEAHEANFSSPLAHAIPCSVERALELCGAKPKPPSPPPPPPPPPPGPHLGAIYVSASRGSDSHSGATPAQALQTLAAGLSAVTKAHATKLLLDGTFHPSEQVVLSKWTAGTGLQVDKWPDRPVPVVSGGVPIPATAWTRSVQEPGVWQADVAGAVSAALDGGAAIYVDGERRAVARTPTLHWNSSLGPRFSAENKLGFVYAEGDIPASWSLAPEHLSRWRVAAFHSFNKAYHHVKSIDRANREIRFVGPSQFGYGDYTYCSKERYYFENVPEMTLQPGSGHWRSSATTLFYAPLRTEDMASVQVVVPVLEQILVVYASGVSLNNLIVEHSAGVPNCGNSTASRGACDSDLAEMAEGAIALGAGATGVSLTNVTLRDVGGYGVKANSAPGLSIERAVFRGCGAGGALINSSPLASIQNSYVIGFGERYPGGVGIVLGNSPNGTVAHCDISGGLYNGIVYGGVNDAGAFQLFEFNHVHNNGHASDDGICDFGAIHGSNPNSTQPIYIRNNLFHSIQAFQNGGNGIYMDAGSVGLEVSGNLVHNVTGASVVWNGGHMSGHPFPTADNSGTTKILNNVLISDRDNGYYQGLMAGGQTERNAAINWNGFTPAQMQKNVIAVDSTNAPSRQAFFNGQPCASSPKGARNVAPTAAGTAAMATGSAAVCSWDLADSFKAAVLRDNVYFNATGAGTLSHSFPGSCESTPLGACCATHGGRSEYNHGCACASLAQWLASGEDNGSLTIDPQLAGPLRLVTSPAVLALGVQPLHQLTLVGPNWQLVPEDVKRRAGAD